MLAAGYATITAGLADRITDTVQAVGGRVPITFDTFVSTMSAPGEA